MRFRRGQNRYNLPIFTVLFISLSLFIFLYLGLHFFIYYIFLSKPLTLVLIPTWPSTFFICFKRNFKKIKIVKKTKEKAIFYSIFVTFLVFYFYFYHTPALIVAQTHYPNRCSSSSDCPSGQRCCGGSCTTPITCTIKTCKIFKELENRSKVDSSYFKPSYVHWPKSMCRWNEGDVVVQIFHYANGQTYVIPPSIVKRVEPRGSHVYCILEEPRGFREIPWKLFKKAMKDAGLQNITKNSNRKVTRPEIISAIYGLWAKH
jgi:hypothetical protein